MPMANTPDGDIELAAVLWAAPEGGFVAMNPETGTTTQGETQDVALANLIEATTLFLEESPLVSADRPLVTPSAFVPLPELPIASGRDVVRTLEGIGFRFVRQRGSHVLLRWGSKTCVVPLHREVKLGTLRGILRQAGVTTGEFLDAFG